MNASAFTKVTAGVVVGVSLFAGALDAQVMQSSNYRIELDSVNSGGARSGSASFRMEDTVGEQATDRSGSANYNVKAGYQQMSSATLTLTGAANVTMSPALQTTGGGTSTGSLPLTATTNNMTGYELSIKASLSPAMQAGTATIANYAPAGADPDFTFTVASASAAFGFSPEGNDVVQKYLDNGTVCNTGALNTANACWNLLSTTDDVIARKNSANNPLGTVTTLKFRIDADAAATLTAGTYYATSTVTLIAL